jgi:hypothetical protein
MRITITLDEDVVAALKAEMRRSGKSLKQAVNDVLRVGLNTRRESPPAAAFRIEARDLGNLRPGVSLDTIGEVLEMIEE